jgi:branched-chain amino acid aminotransferase
MSKPTIDFSNLTFDYYKTDYSYFSFYRNGDWEEGILSKDDNITISAFSTAIHYGQQAFEGMKAYRFQDGSIHLFRPEENANRFQHSCQRLLMPEISTEKFLEAIKRVVKANQDFVPPYESKATLYIRPFMIGVGHNLGVKPAKEYLFGILCSPVGPYFKHGLSPVNFMVSDYDRAAPRGTGDIKVGGNYAASLYSQKQAKNLGFVDCIYLDPTTHTKIEEVGSANFFAITNNNEFVTPVSPSILPSITKYSLMHIAKEYLGMIVKEEDVFIDKLDGYVEAGACGTAAVISPIGGVYYKDKLHVFHSESEVGPMTKKLYEILTKIQFGDIEGPKGWLVKVD